MKKVRFALIGSGIIADLHARVISMMQDAILVGVYNANISSAEKFANKYGIKVFNSFKSLLESNDVDCVCICTPNKFHTEQAVAAMRSGKHVVCEKPMSITLKEADEFIRTANETGVKTCIISQFRYSDATQEVMRAIKENAFGKIVSASLQMNYFRSHEYYASQTTRGTWEVDGGGCLMNQGIHGIDIFRYLMGPFNNLKAFIKTQTRNIEVEDSAVAIVQFANGALGTIEGSTTSYPGYARRIQICGDKGSIVLEEDSILSWDLPITCNLPVGEKAKNVASSDPTAIDFNGHKRQYSNMVKAILYNEALMAEASSGRPPLEVILGIYESGRTGEPYYFN